MIEIWLTNSNKITLVDESDRDLVEGYTWRLKDSHAQGEYAATSIRSGRQVKTIYLHRLIGERIYGAMLSKDLQVHHTKNHLDNRRCYLEIIDSKQHGKITRGKI